ncbi:olfactory receptor 143 isoform X1 [Cricetulus griseus]|uniref:olfactory receptor 143 isoform X1 n=1 Tax=Cricetulus griseus TaxID=10029 RepID=UPI0007DA9A19|nr:olfactory receptor 143 isoform X1 [Cricetulus griseus]
MMQMVMENDSSVSEFILRGLTDQAELQLPLFILFLVNYTATVIGNLGLMNLICLNSNLHTPMYFFIFNLSFIDFCYSLVFTPKMLMSFVLEKNTISFRGCMTQLFFFCVFVNSESYVLTAMAYDRYVAICHTAIIVCCLIIFISYAMILFNIIHMSSGKAWSKALGTCGSHIITVSLFYGSGLLAYVKPSSAETVGQGKFFSVFYTLLVPMLNPLIYSLRNKDVKLAVKRTWQRLTS